MSSTRDGVSGIKPRFKGRSGGFVQASELSLPARIDFIQPRNLRLQLLLRLNPIRIGDAAIDRANSCTLGFIMESSTLGTLIRYDVEIIGGVEPDGTARTGIIRAKGLSAESPVSSTLVDGVIRAFWFACTTIDAFGCDHDSHGSLSFYLV